VLAGVVGDEPPTTRHPLLGPTNGRKFAVTRVSVLHNVARDEHDRKISYFGYQDGHPLVVVFEADIGLGDEACPSAVAEEIYVACNLDPDMLTGRMAVLARAYRDRRLRSLSVGDLVVIGDGDGRIAMRVDDVGVSAVAGDTLKLLSTPEELHQVTVREHGTHPWPPDARPIQVGERGRP
jgi:hypothetical protein